jgi:hypothetical protein
MITSLLLAGTGPWDPRGTDKPTSVIRFGTSRFARLVNRIRQMTHLLTYILYVSMAETVQKGTLVDPMQTDERLLYLS